MGTISPESRAKFEANFLAAYQPLMAHAISKLRHKQDAEDLVSRTALKAWRAWPTYTDQNFDGWIHRILTNEIKDFHRSNSHHIPSGYDPTGTEDLRACPPAQEARHECRDVERAISGMEPDVRTAMVRVAVNGESDSDVASDLGLARGTIAKRVHKGRAILKRAAS